MAVKAQTAAAVIAGDVRSALENFNHTQNKSWTFGTNWTSVDKPEFETFINKFLFPKITETAVIQQALGNTFEWLAKEVDFVGQFSEEYVILDAIPTTMDLTKNEELMLKRNYPQMATKLYAPGIVKKMKFTLNNNDVRQNFLTLGDATQYALAVYQKRVSDINLTEEREMKAMLIEYANKHVKDKRTATSEADMAHKIAVALQNLQNNSEKHNEAEGASGGKLARYTTVSKLSKLAILTTDEMKTYLLDTKLANTFESAGIDFTDRIISFDDLGGAYAVKADITVDQTVLDVLKAMGDYQTQIGDIIPEGSIITFEPPASIADKFEEVKPKSELFALIFDIDSVRYRRYTKGMLKAPFINPEFDEVTYWLHYYTFKSISPFYNKIVITGPETPAEPEV